MTSWKIALSGAALAVSAVVGTALSAATASSPVAAGPRADGPTTQHHPGATAGAENGPSILLSDIYVPVAPAD